MSLKDIIITSSIGSVPYLSYGQKTYSASSDDQSYPLETITGSQAGTWPNFVSNTNYTLNLVTNITQSWSGSNITPLGIIPYIHDTNNEFFNGEFSGSNYTVTNGILSDQQFLEANTIASNYSMYPYYTRYIDSSLNLPALFGPFLNRYTAPRDGEFLMHIVENFITSTATQYTNITYVKIARIDQQGVDNTLTLQSLEKIIWYDDESLGGAGEIILDIVNIAEYPDYYLYEVTSKTWINLSFYADDNLLHYAVSASTSGLTVPIREYSYLTSSWTTITDTLNGFNNGQYTFPLTPNCPIYITSSINITVQTPTTFSWAINAFDDLVYPHTVPNAVDSIYTPIGIVNSTHSLAAGTYNLIITSSNYQPIQSYKYEINATTNNNEIIPNSNFTGSNSNWNNGELPTRWRCVDVSSPTSDINNQWFATYDNNGQGFTTLPGYPGGVIFYTIGGTNCMLRNDTVGASSIFTNGKTYDIQIEIPSTFNINNVEFFGPPLQALTCSVNKNDPTNPTNILGYIPSGSSGIFSFIKTMGANDRELCIITPGGASDQISGGKYHYTAIARISSQETASVLVNTLTFIVTQSATPQTATSSFIFEPYFVSNFLYSDSDVLMNNATQNDISQYHQRILYDNDSIIPSNINQIISGTAEPAEINDYLFNSNASTFSRYLGVRSESPGVNQNTTFGGYGVLPNVESLQTYFAYYDYITSSYGELLNKSTAHILYLIDKDGNVLTPTLSSSYYYNLIDNFETNKNVNINLNNLDGTTVIGLKNVLRPGAIPWGICASQTGSELNVASTMSFSNNTSTVLVPKYASLVNGPSLQQFPITPGGGTYAIDLNTTIYSGVGNVTINTGPNNFQILTTSNNVSLNLKLEGSLSLSKQNNNPPSNIVTPTIYCQESPDGSSWTNIDQKDVSITYGSLTYINLNFASFTAIAGKYYRLVLYHGSGYFIVDLRNSKISLIQDPIPTNAGAVTSSFNTNGAICYWRTGSNSKNILTGSQFLPIYNSYKAFQLNYPDSGYKNFLEFNPQSSDEIRFEGDELQTYCIYEVSSDDKALYLRLDRNIVNGTNTDSFLIRRYEPHPNYITLDWDGSGYTNGDGFLFPEYPSSDLSQNFDNIITKLKEKGII